MSVTFRLEKTKSFSSPYEELFGICEKALSSLGLQISRTNQSEGIIEAQKPSRWPFKSKERISLKVGHDSRVQVIAQMDPNKALSSEGLVIDRFFSAVRELIQIRTTHKEGGI
ncbi:MAG TPA: hypothetical protein VMC85_01320 [Desulfomonilaceae bacterium]|nr:hypothetical protein [Desulfomonilaceae bacterium]